VIGKGRGGEETQLGPDCIVSSLPGDGALGGSFCYGSALGN
jgi:hypothetical protein